jgi:Protein of unknown function (DUF4240)
MISFDEKDYEFQDPTQISDWFWSHLDKANKNCEALKEILYSFTLEEIFAFHREFTLACYILQDDRYLPYRELSDDAAQDIVWWVVSQGKDFYFKALEHPEIIPKDAGDDVSLYGVALEVYEEKGGNSDEMPWV